jgi:2-iminobutanoate/2-iminopropanoate deaminase
MTTVRGTRAERITCDPDWYEPHGIPLGFEIDGQIILSGQAPIGPAGEVVGVGDFDAQAHQVFQNIDRVPRAAGSSLGGVVKIVYFLIDRATFPRIVELWQQYFEKPLPAEMLRGRGACTTGVDDRGRRARRADCVAPTAWGAATPRRARRSRA